MPLKIERRFLVSTNWPAAAARQTLELMQGHVPAEGTDGEMRVRASGDSYFLALKTGQGPVREEVEIGITKGVFQALWKMTGGRRVQRKRSSIAYGGGIIEVDEFEGVHAGLTLAEVTFPSEADARVFVAPPWFGQEVTDDVRFKSACLAEHGMDLIRSYSVSHRSVGFGAAGEKRFMSL
ncbi:hypothetical protein AB0C76_08335 [Kitasatospora sp. NPDC048722]|uniref:CYTH domain-containing protein n=1 Tax=Kitasatospora sp. NPDC048722 TaxID=3155639 RepID=UPI0033D21F7F